MDIITYTTIWFALAGLFSVLLLSANPYYKKEFNKVVNRLSIAYEVALHKAEQIEILEHKWLESEKAGHDIGMENAQQSWEKYHARDWRKSRKKAA
tara:strand:+ start:440 stop:727 length:288 start_codon:yes stop_codon:yes gene_type:complete